MIIYSRTNADGEIENPQVAEYSCKVSVLKIGNIEIPVADPEFATWLFSLSAALGQFSEKINKWVSMKEQDMVYSHFPTGECSDCPRLRRKMRKLGQGQPVVLLGFLSTDVLTGTGKEIDKRRLESKYSNISLNN